MAMKVPDDKSISWDSIGRIEKFLTRRWNNWLTLIMGIPLLVLGMVFLFTNVMSDFSGFLVMVIYGAVY